MADDPKSDDDRYLPARAPLVLFAEDMKHVREKYAKYLEMMGFRVAQVQDGRQALEAAIELNPSVILMDLSMPGLDGWQATRRVKTDPRTAHIPVIALTGYGDAEQSAARAGCDGYLAKPCSAEEVVREIRRVLAEPPATDTSEGF